MENKKYTFIKQNNRDCADVFAQDDIGNTLYEYDAIICGNDIYPIEVFTFGDNQRVIEDLAKDFANGYITEEQFVEELENITGKKYERYNLHGCVQREWNYLFYPKEESDLPLDYINDLYFGLYEEYYCEEDGQPYIVCDSEVMDCGDVKTALSIQSGYAIEDIRMGRIVMRPVYVYDE